jgi:acylphosphatase
MSASAGRVERLTAIVRGDVQGVGFRFFVHRLANRLGLRGYVRNQADGSVFVVAEGPRPALDQLLEGLRRGPGGASVDEVETTWSWPEGEFAGFAIRH